MRFSSVLAVAALGVLLPAAALPEIVLDAPPDGTFALPAIPEAQDLALSPEEIEKIRAGEMVVQIVNHAVDDRQARAIGYVRASPVAMFDVAVDSEIAVTFPQIEEATIHATYPHGKRYSMVLDVSWLLPNYEFTSVAAYNEIFTAQSFQQLEGDFDRNEGTHNYLWDPERRQTLAVVTFAFGLKGILSILPERFVLSLASRDLPKAIRRLDDIAVGFAETDPERHARIEATWDALRPRLEAGEFPGQVWPPPPPTPVPAGSDPAR